MSDYQDKNKGAENLIKSLIDTGVDTSIYIYGFQKSGKSIVPSNFDQPTTQTIFPKELSKFVKEGEKDRIGHRDIFLIGRRELEAAETKFAKLRGELQNAGVSEPTAWKLTQQLANIGGLTNHLITVKDKNISFIGILTGIDIGTTPKAGGKIEAADALLNSAYAELNVITKKAIGEANTKSGEPPENIGNALKTLETGASFLSGNKLKLTNLTMGNLEADLNDLARVAKTAVSIAKNPTTDGFIRNYLAAVQETDKFAKGDHSPDHDTRLAELTNQEGKAREVLEKALRTTMTKAGMPEGAALDPILDGLKKSALNPSSVTPAPLSSKSVEVNRSTSMV